MNTIIKTFMLAGLVMSLTACVHYGRPYGNYPNYGYNQGYNQGYGHHHHPRPPVANGYGRPYGYQSNNYYQNNYYNRPQPRNYQGPGYPGNGWNNNYNARPNWGNDRGHHYGQGHHGDDHGGRDRD